MNNQQTYNNTYLTLKEKLLFENQDDLNELSSKWEFSYTGLSRLTGFRVNKTDKTLYLLQNYLNPFNPFITIQYRIPKISFVSLKAYDLLSWELITLVNTEKPAGSYLVEFSGSNLLTGYTFIDLKLVEIK